MPSKKTAPRAIKKSAKHPCQELRRAYEFLGRVDILEGALSGSDFVHVTSLMRLAEQSLAGGRSREAADLLRAAEHLCFAGLAPQLRPGPVEVPAATLRSAIATELESLAKQADRRWSKSEAPHGETLSSIYNAARVQAEDAFRRNAYRPALEFARAAEALSRVVPHQLESALAEKHRLAS